MAVRLSEPLPKPVVEIAECSVNGHTTFTNCLANQTRQMTKNILTYSLLAFLFFSCTTDAELEVTQNLLFLVGDNGEGKAWKLVRAEVPLDLGSAPGTVVYDILQHPEFVCYQQDTIAFFLSDSLWIGYGENACNPTFDLTASNQWFYEEEATPNGLDQIVIIRKNQNLTVEYELPLSSINREKFISDMTLPLKEPLKIYIMGVEAEIYQLDLQLEFRSVNSP